MLFVAILFCVVMASISAMIANSKGHSGGLFFIYGLLIWPVALIHASVLKPTEAGQLANRANRKCPHCAEVIKTEAKVCRFCGRDVEPAVNLATAAHQEIEDSDVVPITCKHCGKKTSPLKPECRNCGGILFAVTGTSPPSPPRR